MRLSVFVRIGPLGPRCSAPLYWVFFLPRGGASGPKLRPPTGAAPGPPAPSRGVKGRGAPPPPANGGLGPPAPGPPYGRGPEPGGRLSRGWASLTASGRPRNGWLLRREMASWALVSSAYS